MGLCRELSKLVPVLQDKAEKFLELCKQKKIDVIVLETYRSPLVQAAYYAQGRENLGNVNTMRIGAGLPVITEKENTRITNTKPGQSKHNVGKAFDVAPIVGNKIMWNDMDTFRQLGEIGKSVGLKWGGDFKSIKDCPHFEI